MNQLEEKEKALAIITAYVKARESQDKRDPKDPGFMLAVRDQMVKDDLIEYFSDGTINLTQKGKKWPGSLNTT